MLNISLIEARTVGLCVYQGLSAIVPGVYINGIMLVVERPTDTLMRISDENVRPIGLTYMIQR